MIANDKRYAHTSALAKAYEDAYGERIGEYHYTMSYWHEVSVESHGKTFDFKVEVTFLASNGTKITHDVAVEVYPIQLIDALLAHYNMGASEKAFACVSSARNVLKLRRVNAKRDAFEVGSRAALTHWIDTYVQDFVDTAIDLLLKEGLIREKQSKRSPA